jgi:glycosyltransferase-like protein
VRVALLTYSTRPRGGVVHTLALAEALAAEGVDVTVVALGRGGDEAFFRPVAPGVDCRIVPFADRPGESLGPRVLRSIGVLADAVDPSHWDVVHAQDCISANAVPGSVRTVHHIDHFETPELVACHDRAIREPRAHVCVSAAVASELREDWGVEATVIPNGVDAARFARAAARDAAAVSARAAWHGQLGPRYVLAVGGIEPRKGTVDLVGAMVAVGASQPDVPLVIAGGETLFDYRGYREEFDRRCRVAGVRPVVLGPVGHDRLPSLVAAATVFAFPSTREGFGLAAMEAAAAGVPLVVRDLPVLRELFTGVGVFASDPAGLGEALLGALAGADPDRIAEGRRLAATYTWRAAARAHLAFYRALPPAPRRPVGARPDRGAPPDSGI